MEKNRVGQLLGATSTYRLYEYLDHEGPSILKIAKAAKDNSILDKEAFILKTMAEEAKFLENDYAKFETGQMLNYQYCFPTLIDSFIDTTQDNRRINILGLSQISQKLEDLAPLSHLVKKENVRVDPRTSAWIIGKLLKILVFSQSQNISIGRLSGDNILINREQHFVSIFDWTQAAINPDKLSSDITSQEISMVAKQGLLALGAMAPKWELPDDPQLENKTYENFLKSLLQKNETWASVAHKKFYEMILSLWPREFYPFTTYKF